MKARKKSEIEKDRQELLAELSMEELEQSKAGSFGCHELLDRTSLLANNLAEFVLSHPACLQNPEWFALADRAAEALHDLYQQVGAEHLEADLPKPRKARKKTLRLAQ